MTIYERDEIRAGIVMEKDAGYPCFVAKSHSEPATAPNLSDIQRRLESVRKKLAIVRQVIGQRK